ncbi:MAG: hypothetical protein IJ678_08605 [Kiritimatiellae bacterium]|nr:hypothetical protein [Kiritimatiellia bacterium]
MITILENAQTRGKGTANFVDDRGKVVGFNLAPEGGRLAFRLRAPSGRVVLTDADMPISHYLRGLACHFGPGITFAAGEDGERKAMTVPLVSDAPVAGHGLQTTQLEIEGVGGEYYCDDLGLTPDEIKKLFADKMAVGARKISVDGRLHRLEERVARLEARLAELAAAAR